MTDLITLTCPSCGGKLQITRDIEQFACLNCGNEHIVNRSGGVISLSPVVDGIKEIKTGVDKTASELAIRRLSNDIDRLENEKLKVRSSGYGIILKWTFIIGGSATVIWFLLIPFVNRGSFGSLMCSWWIVLLIGYSVGLMKQQEDISAKCVVIDQQITQITNEINKHQEIVST